jgi:hypothetical protein
MATSTVRTFERIEPATVADSGRIPWYLWCSVLAITSVSIGAHWDVSWHRSIGRDTFWTPAHMAIYLCGVLAGISCGYLILATTFARRPQVPAVSVMGLRAPLGAFVAAWGGLAMITSAPFDNWWHSAYGLDVKIVSPPHVVLMVGVLGVEIGVLFLLIAAMNRASAPGAAVAPGLAKRLQGLLLYTGGLMMVLTMFFRMEYTRDVRLHSSGAYIAMALGVPLCYAMLWYAARHRWAATISTAIYSSFLIALILILPLFPAQPKLGPVFQNVTHMIPPKFPLLLIVPAVALDLLWSATARTRDWMRALVSGPLFVLLLVAVEWPFASFLMTPAAANRFFGTAYHDFAMPSWTYDVSRTFWAPEHGWVLWQGLLWAMLYASVSTWLGMKLGRWMEKIQR